ncbi:hypothetical protein OK016_04330 [Vibrio chagasii]|nr:hypothetical protein [Vibrio chagasii]
MVFFTYRQTVALTMICVGLFWNGIDGIAIVQAGAPSLGIVTLNATEFDRMVELKHCSGKPLE